MGLCARLLHTLAIETPAFSAVGDSVSELIGFAALFGQCEAIIETPCRGSDLVVELFPVDANDLVELGEVRPLI